MKLRHIESLFVIAVMLVIPRQADAQQATTSFYTGNIGGGFAATGGNTDTNNVNITGAVTRDPKTNNVMKASGSFLRGNQNNVLNLDRTSINLRDEYSFSKRTFAFGQLDYVRDQFKQMTFYWAPTGGIGFKLINNDATQLIVDGGAGGVMEKNPGIPNAKAGSVTAGQRFSHKLNSATTFAQSVASIWKTNDFADSLTNFSVSLTTTVVGNIQVKVEFLDNFRNKPANVGLKKNDTAFVTAFVMKF